MTASSKFRGPLRPPLSGSVDQAGNNQLTIREISMNGVVLRG